MKKRSLLTLLDGSFEQGFPVILQISSDPEVTDIETQVLGRLPPAPDLWLTWQNWQQTYHQIISPPYRIKAKSGRITNISYHQIGSELKYLLNIWLNQGNPEWQKIRDCLQRNLHHSDEIEIVIQTSDTKLQRLPWHLWDFFDHYPHAEIAFSICEYQKPNQLTASKTKNQVKILAILGDCQNLNLAQDRAYLEKLSPQAEITFLVEPPLSELNDQLWDTSWDILFFAGHSSSHEQGKIWLNKTDILTLEQFKYALKKAIDNGLQLAIFNSCDGLGLARELAGLQLGQIVVMREPVPDIVAQIFLKYFLLAFAEGQSLYSAVRTARERLQKLEAEYPYATWLPVIFQNPATVTPTWQNLTNVARNYRYQLFKRLLSPLFFATSLAASVFFLENIELDILHLLRLISLSQKNTKDTNQSDPPEILDGDGENIDEDNLERIIPDKLSSNQKNKKIPVDRHNASSPLISSIEDINNDNINELLIDLPNSSDTKRKIYVVFGEDNDFGYQLNLDNLNGNNGFIISQVDWKRTAKVSVKRIRDVNKDDIDEILIDVSNPNDRTRKIYVVFGEDNQINNKSKLASIDRYNDFVDSSDCRLCSVASLDNNKDSNSKGSVNHILDNVKDKITSSASLDDNKDSNSKVSVNHILDNVKDKITSSANNSKTQKTQTFFSLKAKQDSLVKSSDDKNHLDKIDEDISIDIEKNESRSLEKNKPVGKSAPNIFPREINLEKFKGFLLYLDEAQEKFNLNGIFGKTNSNNLDGNIIINVKIGRINNISINPIPDFSIIDNGILPGSTNNTVLIFDDSNDSLRGGKGDDILIGGGGRDTLRGGRGDDTLYGSAGNDSLRGGKGDDILIGGNGRDTLRGGRGDDTLYGSAGNDSLSGGRGNDIFIFMKNSNLFLFNLGVDRITDFSIGVDRIILDRNTFTALDKNPQDRLRNSDFAIVTSNADAKISNAEIVYNSGNGRLFYNENNDAAGFGNGGLFAILNDSPDNLSNSDFQVVDL